MIAVLTAHLPGIGGDVPAGEAMQRVLLTATADGLAVSFLSQLIEVPEVREAVRRLVGTVRPPLAVLRIGHGWPTPRTPRRDVADLLMDPETSTRSGRRSRTSRRHRAHGDQDGGSGDPVRGEVGQRPVGLGQRARLDRAAGRAARLPAAGTPRRRPGCSR